MGVCFALRAVGGIASIRRTANHTIAKSDDTDRMMAEQFGRSNGYCHGNRGSVNITDLSAGMLGTVTTWALECPYSPAQTRTSCWMAATRHPMKKCSMTR